MDIVELKITICRFMLGSMNYMMNWPAAPLAHP